MESITRGDDIDRVTYHRTSYGIETWYKYDEKGSRTVYDINKNIISQDDWYGCYPWSEIMKIIYCLGKGRGIEELIKSGELC